MADGWNPDINSWQRRATPAPTARGAQPKSVRKRSGSPREPPPAPTSRRLTPGSASTVLPPPPTRSPPPTTDVYRDVASFDDACAPWSRDSFKPLDTAEPEPPVAQCARERWVRYGHRHTPQESTGWRPHMAGFNEFLCHECRTVFPDLYQGVGHTRADDVQAVRQARRAARRYSAQTDSPVPGAQSRNVPVHPADAYLGDNCRLLTESDDPQYPIVHNDQGVPQPLI